MTTTPHVLTRTHASTGIIELNRPKALNALDAEIIDSVIDSLGQWKDDPEIHRVIIISNHERAFCAGGDIKVVQEQALAGDHQSGDAFLQREYTMNSELARFPKPIVSIIDGIVMGGGLGLSMHGSHRVISENALAAMPEVAIGFVPDVGMTYMHLNAVSALGRPLPAVAKFFGITGYRMTASDMLFSGLATHLVPHDHIAEFTDALIAESIDDALDRFATSAEEDSFLKQNLNVIEECFGHDSWADMETALEQCADKEFVDLVRDLMSGANPASVVAAAELYAANEDAISLEVGLRHEYAIGSVLRRQPNFCEGVRAVLVDKDRNPKFVPDTIAEVDPDQFREVLSH